MEILKTKTQGYVGFCSMVQTMFTEQVAKTLLPISLVAHDEKQAVTWGITCIN